MTIRRFLVFGVGKLFPDKIWIRIKYFQWFRKLPNLKNPQTFNEKLNWLKLYDRRPEYTTMVDKYESKKYVSDCVGSQYVIPVVGGPWDTFDEIDFNKLPDQFVLKTTHDCGGVLVCKNKKNFDKEKARNFLEGHLKNNYYLTCREWPYKNVKPRIFAEEYMKDAEKFKKNNTVTLTNNGTQIEQLTDYKFFCFNGEVKALLIATDRADTTVDTKFDFFDAEFTHLDLIQGHPNATVLPQKPVTFNLMKRIASKLSKGIPQIRVDFYEVENRVYVGELTLFHFSGNVPFQPEKWDHIFGSWIQLPKEGVKK